MTAPQFFTQEWADAVRDALTAGPDTQARSSKLQEYWDFFDWLKSQYPSSWALGCRDLSSYLVVQWGDGKVTDARIVGPDDPPPTSPAPSMASYVLCMDYQDWKALHEGYDAQRTVMYRKMLLEGGDLLEFFKGIYFFVESLSVIGTVPATYP
jgi:hypothetical protein